ncbi:hypothetical protein CJF32_00008399 [Rutstroemia sp. NJR-2017a WRK4]|nr:hypothetical protein CJF32_00008399 [Rutstroemia sp. NJR-2017a WRK4]
MPNLFGHFNLPADFLTRFLKSQFTTLPHPTHPFTSQTILITGSNTGLGLSAATHFVRLGASRVILACRSLQRGLSAASQISSAYPSSACVIEVWQVDVGNYASVQEFCARVAKLERLDVVVENAGIAVPRFELLEGMESTVTVNVLGTFLMALGVLPSLRESARRWDAQGRLVIVASDAHEQAMFRERKAPNLMDALRDPNSSYQQERYNVSKLLEILVVRELASKMTASGKSPVILNTLTPGFCHSELMRHALFPLNVLAWLGKALIARTTEVGSRTLVAAAAAGEESHGQYMADCKVDRPSKWVRSEEGMEVQKRVYEEVMLALEEIQPGITKNI